MSVRTDRRPEAKQPRSPFVEETVSPAAEFSPAAAGDIRSPFSEIHLIVNEQAASLSARELDGVNLLPQVAAAQEEVDGPGSVVEPFPIAPFSISFDVSEKRLNEGMQAITTDATLNFMCAALVDLTGDPTVPPYVGLNDTEVIYPGSLQKISAMYAAFELRSRVRSQVRAAITNGLSTSTTGWEKPIIKALEHSWKPKLRAAFLSLPPSGFPELAQIFTFSRSGEVRFAEGTAITDDRIDTIGEFGTPQGGFGNWMKSMMRWSNNAAAAKCIRALGFPYINGALRGAGLFSGSPPAGLWVSGDYEGHDWILSRDNRAGRPLTARWAVAQKRKLSNFTATAAHVARLMTLLAQGRLVDRRSSLEMLLLMIVSGPGGGIGSYVREALRAHRPDAVYSKIGLGDDGRAHDCAIVERTAPSGTRIRYVVVGLGSKETGRAELRNLFAKLDELIVSRHP